MNAHLSTPNGNVRIDWMNHAIPYVLNVDITPAKFNSALDVGCGKGALGYLLKAYRPPAKLVGIDVFQPYLEYLYAWGCYDVVYRLDLAKEILPFKEKEFDVVFCLDTLEHLEHDEAMRLLADMEGVGKRVVLTSMSNFIPQPDFDDNSHQRHKCLVTPRFLRSRGYNVRGINPNGFWVFGRYFSLNLLPPVLAQFVPSLGDFYIAWRDPQ